MRVLLVEDDPTIARFVGKGLREAGFAGAHAADGVTALERAVAEPYDAAIVDVMLPRMDGLSLIDALRARGVRLPVLILSAKRSVDDRVRAHAARRRRPHAGSADAQGVPRDHCHRPASARVFPARIPDAQCGQGAV